jgi:phthalate 4,5-dioxygenase
MLSKEDNELLTRTGPGTPMGELFRRFWMPAMLSEELPGPDCVPVRLRLLSEDLIAFRDSEGRVGVVDAYCPHRGAPMFFGRNEESGLRCVYHGWKFDVDGNCVDLPNAPEGETFKHKVKITAYPAVEGGRIVWVYIGPLEKMPPPPGFEWFELPVEHTHVAKYLLNCNYMQAVEGDIDPSHNAYLHYTLDNNASNPSNTFTGAPATRVLAPEFDVLDFEVGVGTVRNGAAATARQARTGGGPPRPGWVMPFYGLAGLASRGLNPLNIKVPSDDENIIYFRVRWSEQPLTQAQLEECRVGGYINPPVVPGTFVYAENKSNDYKVDRIRQKYFNFSGLSQTAIQDTAMQENQRGPIMDRSQETLVSADKYIIRVRQRLLSAAKALQDGVEPVEPWRPQAYKTQGANPPPPLQLIAQPIAVQ